jgi:hypothetical protein
VVALSLSMQEVVSSSFAGAGRVKIGSCSFAKGAAFRRENHGVLDMTLNTEAPCLLTNLEHTCECIWILTMKIVYSELL